MWSALVGALAAAVPRWWYYRRRSKIAVHRGAPRGTRRELRRIVKRWPELAEDIGLAGAYIQRAVADAMGITLTLLLLAGLTAADLTGALGRVESVVGTRPGAARLDPDPNRANHAFIRILRVDPLAVPLPWPGRSGRSIVDPLTLGLFDNGEPTSGQGSGTGAA